MLTNLMDCSSIFLERLGKTTEENSVKMAGLWANILNWDFFNNKLLT
jgi:hypothetical protein